MPRVIDGPWTSMARCEVVLMIAIDIAASIRETREPTTGPEPETGIAISGFNRTDQVGLGQFLADKNSQICPPISHLIQINRSAFFLAEMALSRSGRHASIDQLAGPQN
jgi:hypothetical protein